MKAETITVKEAAQRIGISQKTAYTLVKKNEFPVRAVRVGSQDRKSVV